MNMNMNSNKFNLKNCVAGQDVKFTLADGRSVAEICFDNAATTPPFASVIKDLLDFVPYYSSVHRGKGYKSQICSDILEQSRLEVLNFVKGDPVHDVVIYVKNATEGINKLSNRLAGNEKNIILTTYMEHHSNDLPWRKNFQVDYVKIDQTGRLLLNDLEEKLMKYRGKVNLVAVTGASNVTGYINPIYEIAEMAHRYDARVLVDAAQLAPHYPINMNTPESVRHIDYLVFSAHKMYAPFGIGVLIGPRGCFQEGAPDDRGDGTVKMVTDDYILWDDPPHKEEAGTPDLMGVVALISAIKTLNRIGMVNLASHEQALTQYAFAKLKRILGLTLYSALSGNQAQVGIIPFNMRGISYDDLAARLSNEAGIAVRSGCFCAHPYVQRLLKVPLSEIKYYKRNPAVVRPGMVRLSFGIYNDCSEIDLLASYLEQLSERIHHGEFP